MCPASSPKHTKGGERNQQGQGCGSGGWVVTREQMEGRGDGLLLTPQSKLRREDEQQPSLDLPGQLWIGTADCDPSTEMQQPDVGQRDLGSRWADLRLHSADDTFHGGDGDRPLGLTWRRGCCLGSGTRWRRWRWYMWPLLESAHAAGLHPGDPFMCHSQGWKHDYLTCGDGLRILRPFGSVERSRTDDWLSSSHVSKGSPAQWLIGNPHC